MGKERYNPFRSFVGSFIPNWLLKRTEITSGAKLVFARLCQYAGESGECFPLQQTISEETGISLSMVKRHIAELVKFGLIESVQQGLSKPNIYYFLSHEWISGNTAGDTPERPPVILQEIPPVIHIRESIKENHLKHIPLREKEVLVLPYTSASFVETWEHLRKSKKWKNKSIDALKASLYKLSKHNEEEAIEMMLNSIAGEWQGLFEITNKINKNNGNNNRSNNKHYDKRREVTREDLERVLALNISADPRFKEDFSE